ncbi:MAG: TetR/AcrR family transcriptional regulator [Bulleidia sp.]
MKREEKNRETKRKIMDRALAEFAQYGYGGSSVNTICTEGISKGIIYHYFNTKDDLYLACVQECFDELCKYISSQWKQEDSPASSMRKYFSIRASFFQLHPLYQPLFCDAMIAPPHELREQIHERIRAFEELNVSILQNILSDMPLRSDVTMEEIIETFRLFQNFINAADRYETDMVEDYETYDHRRMRALDILLYGVIERKE